MYPVLFFLLVPPDDLCQLSDVTSLSRTCIFVSEMNAKYLGTSPYH